MTGNQIVNTLPLHLFAPYDNHNAKPTNQLQPIPDPNVAPPRNGDFMMSNMDHLVEIDT